MTDASVATAYAVPIELRLRYAHGLGGLSPYFAGLERGAAMATRCSECSHTWYAPRLSCLCGNRVLEWVQLSGRGVIVALTRARATLPATQITGAFVFALIRLDGADNRCFGRLGGATAELTAGSAVRLRRAEGSWPHPAQCAEYVAD